MIAFSLPEIPSKLTAAIMAAAALVIFTAARRSDDRFERIFASGFAASTLWSIYFVVIRGPGFFSRAHTFVFFGVMTLSLLILIVAFALARPLSQRLAALALVLLVGRDWWESVVSLACGRVYGIRCLNESGLATKHIPGSINLILVLGAIALMISAAIIAAETPPSRWILASLGASFLVQLYFAILVALRQGHQMRVLGLVNLLGYGASLGLAIRAAQERTRQATVLFGAGLAIFAVLAIWSGLRDLTMM